MAHHPKFSFAARSPHERGHPFLHCRRYLPGNLGAGLVEARIPGRVGVGVVLGLAPQVRKAAEGVGAAGDQPVTLRIKRQHGVRAPDSQRHAGFYPRWLAPGKLDRPAETRLLNDLVQIHPRRICLGTRFRCFLRVAAPFSSRRFSAHRYYRSQTCICDIKEDAYLYYRKEFREQLPI